MRNSIIIGLVLAVIIFFSGWFVGITYRGESTMVTTDTTTQVLYDTTMLSEGLVPDTVFLVDNTSPAPFWTMIDTAQIVEAYFKTHIYQNSYQDSTLKIKVSSLITKNTLDSSWFDYQLIKPTIQRTILQTQIIQPAKWQILAGATFGGYSSGSQTFAPMVSIHHREGYQFSVGYNLLDPGLTFSAQIKLFSIR